ncbi:hypothetical protein SNE40_001780 [Patella caerulea]|uniref:Uncharacterized protein n=2 Tax=Patella caerulea TaxID=87958 RepID=A0AAN8QDM8_PATCE
MECHRFRVNRRRNYHPPQRRMASPPRKHLSRPEPNTKIAHGAAIEREPRGKGNSGLYPTLSSCYRRENLDYSPPEPTADYPYTDDLPMNNIYPRLNIVKSVNDNTVVNAGQPRLNIVESVVDNTAVNELSPSNENPNMDFKENKVLNDKGINVSDEWNRDSIYKNPKKPYSVDPPTPDIFIPDSDYPMDINNPPPKNTDDFNRWMTWRKQVNRHMASMILLKQGKEVHVAPSEVNRKPLPKSTMKSVFDQAKIESERKTSLPGKPYIMYGIPRVQLLG